MRTSEYNKLPKWYYRLPGNPYAYGPTGRMTKADIKQIIPDNTEYWRA